MPRRLLSAVRERSPSIRIVGWLSTAVEKLSLKVSYIPDAENARPNIWLLRVGITVLRGINFENTPPVVSIPSVRGWMSIGSQEVVPSAPEDTAQDCGTICYGLIKVMPLEIFAEVLPKKLLNLRNVRWTSDEDNLVIM
jgi:hypothetical protein